MEKISWTDRVRNEEVLNRVKEERNILHAIKRRKVNWIGHILRRNCLLKHVSEGNTYTTATCFHILTYSVFVTNIPSTSTVYNMCGFNQHKSRDQANAGTVSKNRNNMDLYCTN
jgi:hypothetical protein